MNAEFQASAPLEEMRTCIYCLEEKPASAFNREHVVHRAFGHFQAEHTAQPVLQWITSFIPRKILGTEQSHTKTGKIGKKGVFTIPASLRKRFGLHDGSLVIAEERADGILLRPAVATVIEMYDDRRTAEFLLSNATDAADYKGARDEVRALGLDPDAIPHRKPA